MQRLFLHDKRTWDKINESHRKISNPIYKNVDSSIHIQVTIALRLLGLSVSVIHILFFLIGMHRRNDTHPLDIESADRII